MEVYLLYNVDVQEVLEEREMLKQQTASLQDENTKLQHALDHDPQSKLLHKLHEDIQVLRTGVKDISEEVRNVNKQICDPSSRSSKLEVCMYVCVGECLCACMCMCTHACMCMCVCVLSVM